MANSTKSPVPTSSSSHSIAELFDLAGVLRIWAIDTFKGAADRRSIQSCGGNKLSGLDVKLVWDDVLAWCDAPRFEDENSILTPKSTSLFKSAYSNNTDGVQEYNFRADRSTRSTAEIEISKGFISHREFGIKLQVILFFRLSFYRVLNTFFSSFFKFYMRLIS